ncbi:MAG: ash family protein [Escherichia coli]
MSALVLCGNSGVILLSVKDHQHIDSAIPGRYTVQAPYKAGVGIGVLEKATAYNRVDAVFLYALFCHAQIMVGRTGASQDAPVRVAAGNANSVRLTTSMIGVLCGEFFKLATEAAIMATIQPSLNLKLPSLMVRLLLHPWLLPTSSPNVMTMY